VGCARCHGTNAHISDDAHNTGLDATITDIGAGNGRFKAPSLRNIAVRGPYMHDGRFKTLEEVVEFYNSGVQNNPGLDPRLRGPGGAPVRLNLTATQKAALVAFMRALTDDAFLTDPRLANPFAR
jgi:cytochrome c peroxidase